MAATPTPGDELYRRIVADFTPALLRLGRGYEHDPERRRDLHQEILVGLWRSLPSFEERCSLRTWVLRVAHNVAATHVTRARRRREGAAVSLDDLESLPDPFDPEASLDRRERAARLAERIRDLVPLDRQIILLWLEGVEPAEIAEITGLTTTNVSTKVHRIKGLLQGGRRKERSP